MKSHLFSKKVFLYSTENFAAPIIQVCVCSIILYNVGGKEGEKIIISISNLGA